MTFLPEDDQDFLREKGILFELRSEALPDGNQRRAIILNDLMFEGNLYYRNDKGLLVRASSCTLAVLIPKGYSTTKLDSFYTAPRLIRVDGTDPDRASGQETFFDRSWQFWSRHLQDNEWRTGVDGLQTYLQYIRAELRKA